MKYLLYIIFPLVLLIACADPDAPKDIETNKYYADYLKIYEAYDSLGNEQTLIALDKYLEEYPERNDAYIFKAYILANMEQYDDANKFFEIAKEKDALNIKTYEFQSAFMLYDTSKQLETRKIIEEGIAINDSSAVLMNNLAWLNILDRQPTLALENILQGLTFDQGNMNLYRTGFVAAVLAEDLEMKSTYSQAIDSLGIANPIELEEQLKDKGPLQVLKSIK